MAHRLSPEVILASPEKAELVDAIEKAKAIHEKLKAIDAEMIEIGAMKQSTAHDHSEFRYEFSEDNDTALQLLCDRVLLVRELAALSNA